MPSTSSRSHPDLLVYYGSGEVATLARHKRVVLQADHYLPSDLKLLAAHGTQALAYLSLGEDTGPEAPWQLAERNPVWGGHYVDPAHPEWLAHVRAQAEVALADGFTGLLLDTLDTPTHLERQDPVGKRGMRQAAVDLVRAIRRHYPGLTLIMNRGYDLLPTLAPSLDALMAESLITTADAEGCKWNSDAEIAQHMALIARAAHRRPPLPVLSLDYWQPEDRSGIRQIYRRERELGHLPYVATRLLETIVTEPAES